MQIDGEIPGQRLRITLRVNKQAAIETPDFEVSTPERSRFDSGEIGDCPLAEGGVIPAPLDDDGIGGGGCGGVAERILDRHGELLRCSVGGERHRDGVGGGVGGGGDGDVVLSVVMVFHCFL